MSFTPGFFEEYIGQPFAVGTTDGDFLYGVEFFWDASEAQGQADFLNTIYDLPPEGAYQVIELHQEYYIDVLRYEHRDRYGNLVGEPSICIGSAVEDLDIELAEGDTLTVTAKRMLKREFDEMEES